MKRLTAFAATAILATPVALAAEPLMGRASAIDGDALEIHKVRVRLEGIDVTEYRQTRKMKGAGEMVCCGQKVAFFLADMIGGRTVSCTKEGRDHCGWTLAYCEVAGQNIIAAMVRAGWALAFQRYNVEYAP